MLKSIRGSAPNWRTFTKLEDNVEDVYKARGQARGRLQRGRLQARGRLQRGIFGQKHVILNVQGHHLLLTPHTNLIINYVIEDVSELNRCSCCL